MTYSALTAIALAALLAACDQSPQGTSAAPRAASSAPTTRKPAVVVSFYPLYEFARQVAGDLAAVSALVPAGVEPHEWEPAPQDVARLEAARLFLYNGAGFEPWADKLLVNIGRSGPVAIGRSGPVAIDRAGPVVVVATQDMALLRADLPGHDHGPAQSTAKTTAAEQDPHVWLDPVLAQQQVETIRTALARADPDNAERYAANARAFGERLRALDQRYERGLAHCKRREIVVSHASFAYLAKRYGLTQVPIMGLSPDSEPSPAQLGQIVRLARRRDVKVIFFETLVSPKLAETLAREVGAQTLVLNPIEGLTKDDQAVGRGYVELMDDNLTNLRRALECT